jgi:hypothetical protein
MTDYERGVEQASAVYKDVIREYVAENAKLRKLVMDMYDFFCVVPDEPHVFKEELDFSVDVWRRMRELGIEANE